MTITITGAPKLTPGQIASMRAEQQRIDATYPGQQVAYVEEWDGDEYRIKVVAASPDGATFQKLLAQLAPEVRRKMRGTRVPRADVLEIPTVFLD